MLGSSILKDTTRVRTLNPLRWERLTVPKHRSTSTNKGLQQDEAEA